MNFIESSMFDVFEQRVLEDYTKIDLREIFLYFKKENITLKELKITDDFSRLSLFKDGSLIVEELTIYKNGKDYKSELHLLSELDLNGFSKSSTDHIQLDTKDFNKTIFNEFYIEYHKDTKELTDFSYKLLVKKYIKEFKKVPLIKETTENSLDKLSELITFGEYLEWEELENGIKNREK